MMMSSCHVPSTKAGLSFSAFNCEPTFFVCSDRSVIVSSYTQSQAMKFQRIECIC